MQASATCVRDMRDTRNEMVNDDDNTELQLHVPQRAPTDNFKFYRQPNDQLLRHKWQE